MGKYTKLRGSLPRFENEPSWQARVDALKAEILCGGENSEDANAQIILGMLCAAKLEKRRLEALLSDQTAQIEATCQILVAIFESDGVEKLTAASGVTASLKDEVYPSVEDREKFFAYIKKTRQTNLLSVHHQTMKALVNEMLLAGKPAPPGIKATLKTTIGLHGLKGYDNGE